jgi:hypothetical protein
LNHRPTGYVITDVSGQPHFGKAVPMVAILLTMLVIVLVAGLVVVYVAFPHRGEDVPRTPWVGEAMRKGVEKLPTLDNRRQREHVSSDR